MSDCEHRNMYNKAIKGFIWKEQNGFDQDDTIHLLHIKIK